MATASQSYSAVWEVWVGDSQQTASAALVVALHEKGYPVGAMPTALTWVPAIPGDVNGDGCTDDADLLTVLFQFGSADPIGIGMGLWTMLTCWKYFSSLVRDVKARQ